MEFLLYLTPIGNQILNRVMMKNFNVVENGAICRNHQLLGLMNSPNFTICTNNIKNSVSPVSFYVNETVYHESVHVAQACKRGSLGIKDIQLSPDKLTDVMNSVKIYDKGATVYEMEAYYLEDKPEQVVYYLKKFCF
jgi:hypothetical protein